MSVAGCLLVGTGSRKARIVSYEEWLLQLSYQGCCSLKLWRECMRMALFACYLAVEAGRRNCSSFKKISLVCNAGLGCMTIGKVSST